MALDEIRGKLREETGGHGDVTISISGEVASIKDVDDDTNMKDITD